MISQIVRFPKAMWVSAERRQAAPASYERIRDLPSALTGLGLDQPLAVILAATTGMDRKALDEVRSRFCSTWPSADDHLCGCTAMDVVADAEETVTRRRVDAHVTAEDVSAHRLFAAWVLEHHGPQMSFNGTAVEEYLERFSAYNF